MTVSERLAKFDADFEKLKRNREKVPLLQLQTEYAEPYNALVAEVTAAGDWFADEYLKCLDFPRHPKDTAGNEWLDRRIAAILQQENQPGGRRDRWRAALIDRLDKDEFEQLVYERYERCLKEAFDPYWQRHNRWIGEPDNRWIYNDIFQKFWWPQSEAHPGSGCWITKDYTGHDTRYPPDIGADPEQEGNDGVHSEDQPRQG